MIDSPTPSASVSATTVRWSGLTDRGRVRANNEDAFLALAFDGREIRYLGKTGEGTLDGVEYLFAVSDGMGGAKSGEIASKLAVDRIAQLLPQRFSHTATAGDPGRIEVLSKLFSSIHHDLLVLGASYEECAGMGATLSLCWLTATRLHFGHVGDSRIYSLPHQGGIVQLTHDHNHVGWLRRRGQINEREARMHPLRHSLHQAIGAGAKSVEPHIGFCDCTAGDRFLICSDGVTDGLWDRHLDEMIREGSAHPEGVPVAQRIVKEAVERSGRDNATALVFELLGPAAAP